MKQEKKRIFSGIQPSGNLHIGNYLGAVTQWVDLQKDHDCIFCVVDYHAITVKQDPAVLRKKIVEVAKIYLAAGIDPKKSIIFQQSDVTEHTELAWILNTITRNSDLTKMTQFKDKTGIELDDPEFYFAKAMHSFSQDNTMKELELLLKQGETAIPNKAFSVFIKYLFEEYKNLIYAFNKIGVGLFDYPVLMASDILLYGTDVVPVGDDQLQHVELTRDLGRRFNQQFSEIFKIPEPKILKEGARIMGLDDPTKKMSKSAKSEYNYIALTDDPEKAAKKIMRAETDSGSEVKFDIQNKPGISNLLIIYSLLSGESRDALVKKYEGKGYGDFKKDLAEVVKTFLNDFQKKYNKISDKEVAKILEAGAKKAKPIAHETLIKVKKAIGIN